MLDSCVEQVRLLVDVLPKVATVSEFALKGGTAINLFHRNMPRLSVDIDLTWLPLGDRSTSLIEIDDALNCITASIMSDNPNIKARRASNAGNNEMRVVVTRGRVQIKIENSPVTRGTVHPPRTMQTSNVVSEQFGFVEMKVLSFEDLFAGKLVAALDRQHPRDLFDVMLLYENEGLTDELFRVFMVYVVCSGRPMHELLAPQRSPQSASFTTEFSDMTRDPISPKKLLKTWQRLCTDVQSRLTGDVAEFLLSCHDGKPDFNLIGFPEAANLPAVRWKRMNLARLQEDNPKKHRAQRFVLEKLLNRNSDNRYA